MAPSQFKAPVIGGFFFCFTLSVLAAAPGADEFDGWNRFSEYVAVADGTRLAIDYYRPTRAGELHEQPLPVVWRFTPYGRYLNPIDPANPHALPSGGAGLNSSGALEVLLRSGYVVAVADVRGYGASFGVSETWLGPRQAEDARDITDWLAAHSWTTDKVGMMGLSYLGSVQYMAASRASPHLKAIFAAMAQIDHYETFMLNGIYRPDLAPAWGQLRAALDFPGAETMRGSVAAVEADTDRSQIRQAALAHRHNRDLGQQMARLAFRDSIDPDTGRRWHVENSAWNYLDQVEGSGVAIYHWAGWWDTYCKGQILAFNHLSNPQKLHIGPYFHTEHFGIDIYHEAVRWFDHWLKGRDNGISREPAVRYFIAGEDPAAGWRQSNHWPPPGIENSVLHLSSDALLARQASPTPGTDHLKVDFAVTLGGYLERNNGIFRQAACADRTEVDRVCFDHSGYPDLALSYDARSLSYTTAPLSQDLRVLGQPVATFWISSSTDDADIYVVLEEVDEEGFSRFVTDNAIRASHRAIGESPFSTKDVSWISHLTKDAARLPDTPVRVVLDLKPIGNLFEKGHRIRLTIAGADAANDHVAGPDSNQVLSLHRGGPYDSYLTLPYLAHETQGQAAW
ncbi:MAG: CocE/NonD family hydrolase [Lysobacterales bacterium]